MTILSIAMWESIQPCSAPVLERYDGNVFTAPGAPVEINTVANRRHNGNGFRQKKRRFSGINRVNNKENKNNRADFMLYLFAYNIKRVPK